MSEVNGLQAVAWEQKTYGQIRDVGRQDGSILVVPLGSTEQHGHHLPVGTDTFLVNAVAHHSAERVVEEVPILVTPPLWTGYSPHHLSFGGTISLEFDDLLALVEGVATSALESGFDALLLLNGHGGNASLVSAATSTLGTRHDAVDVIGLTYFELAAEFIDDLRESDPGGMGHAGEFETSLMLHLRPDLVDTDRLQGTPLDPRYDRCAKDMHEGGPVSVFREFDDLSTSGAVGDPDVATAELGRRLFGRLVTAVESLLREIYDETR